MPAIHHSVLLKNSWCHKAKMFFKCSEQVKNSLWFLSLDLTDERTIIALIKNTSLVSNDENDPFQDQ